VQNGINVEKDIYAALEAKGSEDPKVVSTALWVGTNLLEPNVVEHNDFVRFFIKVVYHY
jgi:2-dehydropantoate 2-reductase